MQLVTSRPIALPVFKSGRWYDDFAVTGAINPEYNLSAGAKDKTSQGIRLRATTAVNAFMNLPAWYAYSNFEAETVCRLVAGADLRLLVFRYLSATDRMFVQFLSSGLAKLFKIVANVTTELGSVNIGSTSVFTRVNVVAVGPKIQVFINGIKIFDVNETANINNKLFNFLVLDGTVGVAQAEWQYLAIKPL